MITTKETPSRAAMFRQYSQSIGHNETQSDFGEAANEHLSIALLQIICMNFFVSDIVVTGIGRISQNKEIFNKQFKTACLNLRDNMVSVEKTHTKLIRSMLSENHLQCISDMCDAMDEKTIPVYNSLKNELERVFREEYNLPYSNEIAIVFALDCAIGIVTYVTDLLIKQFPQTYVFSKEILIKKTEELSSIACSKASQRMPEGDNINLNKQLGVISIRRRLLDTITDSDLFSDSFVKAGFILSTPENEKAS